jgi:hypothetical protein
VGPIARLKDLEKGKIRCLFCGNPNVFHDSSGRSLATTRQAVYLYHNNEARSYNLCCGKKAICITYSECVFVDLGIQHAMRMHRTVMSSVACPVVGLQYFSKFSNKRYNFLKKKKKLLNMKCVLIFCTTLKFLSLKEEISETL